MLSLNLPPCCHIFLMYIMGFDIQVIHQRIQTTRSHASHCHGCTYCHYCNLDVMLFYNVTHCTCSLFSHVHVNTTHLLNTMCTLVATCMILERLECTRLVLETLGCQLIMPKILPKHCNRTHNIQPIRSHCPKEVHVHNTYCGGG